MKLTERQKEVLAKMEDGEWHSAAALGTNRQILTPMVQHGILRRKMVRHPNIGFPDTGCVYQLNHKERAR